MWDVQERDPLPQLKQYVLDAGILSEQQVQPGADKCTVSCSWQRHVETCW